MAAKTETSPPLAAIVLAAGGSERMGTTKQLVPIGGQPMVRRVTEAVCAADLTQVVVVVGAQAGAVQRALAGLPLDIIVNQDWASGISTSVRAGLKALWPEIEAVVMVLADQPLMRPELIQALVDRYRTTQAPIVAPSYCGQRGNPVLFDRSLFGELLAVEGDQGGRLLIHRHEEDVELVEIDEPALMFDVDTWQDYETLQKGSMKR